MRFLESIYHNSPFEYDDGGQLCIVFRGEPMDKRAETWE